MTTKKIVLVTGGARSGKSGCAELLARNWSDERFYLATCPSCQETDPEMQARIFLHQRQRQDHGWQTVEEPVAIAGILRRLPTGALVLIDCLTLWISNLMYADQSGELDEERIAALAGDVLLAAKERAGSLIMVTGEVGCGLVPELPLARRYRDLVGQCNQTMAAGADRVVHVVCGIAHIIKDVS